jgi:hypothetical protein
MASICCAGLIMVLLTHPVTASAADNTEINVALAANGATITADSEWHGSSFDPGGAAPASRMIDGIIRGPNDPPQFNRWHSDLSIPHPHWVWIRFAKYARIDHVTLWRADIGSPVDFVGEYLPPHSGKLRILFKCRNVNLDQNHPSITINFSPVVSDNFRLFITRSSNLQFPNYCQASELQVFGDWAKAEAQTSSKITPARIVGKLVEGPLPSGLKMNISHDLVTYSSLWLKIAFPLNRPGISFLSIDQSGSGRLSRSLLKPDDGVDMNAADWRESSASSDASFYVSCKGNTLQYAGIKLGSLETGSLSFIVDPKSFRIIINRDVPHAYLALDSTPLRMMFDASVTPPSPMGQLVGSNKLKFPVLLHFPDYGSLLVTTAGFNPTWRFTGYRAERDEALSLQTGQIDNWDATTTQQSGKFRTTLEFKLTNVYPAKGLVDKTPALSGIKRGWLNIFQFRPDIGILANNTISDNCLFCMYEYADQAFYTPPLFHRFTALDMVKMSLDRYFTNASGYGSDGKVFLDTDPALVIAAWDYAVGQHDTPWLARHIKDIEKYANHIIASDVNGNGLAKSTRSGVSGIGIDGAGQWSSNWWDVISFGWEDAYANALDYRAFLCAADLERILKRTSQAMLYAHRSRLIKAIYYHTFYNPETGVLAGWKSKDGQLHDYYFAFVNGIAIAYGLVTPKAGNAIMDRMQAKMKEVGYTNFHIGMPGNLIPIARKDYAGGGVMGQPHKDDGADSFQSYENGGATGSFAYFYIQALYTLNRRAEANHILFEMLKGYQDGVFQNGVGSGVDWKRWNGAPCGYEGLLTDTYYAQTAFITGYLKRGIPLISQPFGKNSN